MSIINKLLRDGTIIGNNMQHTSCYIFDTAAICIEQYIVYDIPMYTMYVCSLLYTVYDIAMTEGKNLLF